MKIVLHDDHGGEHDVTEHVRSLYGHTTNSLDWGSGFLSTDEELEVLEIGFMAGFADLAEREGDEREEVARYEKYKQQDLATFGDDQMRERQQVYYDGQIEKHQKYLAGLTEIRKRRANLFKQTDDVTNFDEEPTA